MMLEIHVLASGRHKKVTGLNCCIIVVIRKNIKKIPEQIFFVVLNTPVTALRESLVSDSYRSSGGRGGVDPTADKLCHISIPG